MNENRLTPIDTTVSPVGLNSSPLRGKTAGLMDKSKQRLQAAFNKGFRSVTEPVKHDQVSVLLLSWERKGSDMDVSDELKALTRVFEDDYHFKVQQKHLTESEKTQQQLDFFLGKFVYKNEGARNLLVVYYAGHGYSGDNPGELHLTNTSNQASRQADRRSLNTVAWHCAEHYFRRVKADVLVIFDCCEAGTLRANSRASARHSFEFLGACDHEQYTPTPGQNSFTSALIWALSQLKDAPGFDSAELREKIMSAPHADSERQTPVLFPREHPNVDHVWIAPKSPPADSTGFSTAVTPSPNASAHYRDDDRPMDLLDMRFRFSKRQTEHQVMLFAEALSQFARDQGSALGIRKVELIDHTSKLQSAAQIVYKRLSVGGCGMLVPSHEDEEDEDESDEVGTPEAQRPVVVEALPHAGEEAERPSVNNVNLGLVQVNAMVGGSQLMTLERLRTFAFGVMLTLVLSRVSFAPFVEMLKSGASWSGWCLSCGRDFCMSHGDGVHC